MRNIIENIFESFWKSIFNFYVKSAKDKYSVLERMKKGKLINGYFLYEKINIHSQNGYIDPLLYAIYRI